MKKHLQSFVLGVVAMAFVVAMTVPALANSLFTITVDPNIDIMVNGEVFQPKNVQGDDVMVFVYQGTTYAPLRALAEAYGLEVGYDGDAKMATVNERATEVPSPEQPESNAEVVHPLQTTDPQNPYIWRYWVEFTATADSDLTIQKMVVMDYLNGRAYDVVFIHEGQDLSSLLNTTNIAAGQTIRFLDNHPVVDYFDTRVITLHCTDKNGDSVVLQKTFLMSNDLTKATVGENPTSSESARNAESYPIAQMLGGVTLGEREAQALVGKSPEEIREKVKTVGDVLAFLIASDMKVVSGDIHIQSGGYDWSYNRSAATVISENGGNCGGISNLVNYLIYGKYEEVGFIHWSGLPGTGGHIINYIKHGGKYYAYDFQQWIGHKNGTNSDFPIVALEKMEDFTEFIRQYQDIVIMISHTSAGTHLPIANRVSGGRYDFSTNYYPPGSDMQVLYTAQGYSVDTLSPPSVVPDWKSP